MPTEPDRRVRVLFADDAVAMRQRMKELLREEPVDIVAEADDGDQALSLARAQEPDVVVLDLVMPVLDGIEAARRIRRMLPRTRVLMLSGYKEEYQIVRALEAGAHGYVAKADAPEELAQAIGEVAMGRRYLSEQITRTMAGRRLPV